MVLLSPEIIRKTQAFQGAITMGLDPLNLFIVTKQNLEINSE